MNRRGRHDGGARPQPAETPVTGAVNTAPKRPATRTRDISGAFGPTDFAAGTRRTIEHTGDNS